MDDACGIGGAKGAVSEGNHRAATSDASTAPLWGGPTGTIGPATPRSREAVAIAVNVAGENRGQGGEEPRVWQSLCFRVSPSGTKYFVKVFVLIGLIVFSGVMLVRDEDCTSQRNWSGLMMICLGCFLPAPKMS